MEQIGYLEGASVMLFETGGKVYSGVITKETDEFVEIERMCPETQGTRVIINKKAIKRIECLPKDEAYAYDSVRVDKPILSPKGRVGKNSGFRP
jgi:hypothetical protein